MSAVIVKLLSNTRGQVCGTYDTDKLDNAFAFSKSKFWWKARGAMKGGWDGKTHLFNRGNETFPVGLYRDVRKHLREVQGLKVKTVDERPDADVKMTSLPKILGGGITLRRDQRICVKHAVKHCRGIIHGATGAGKTEISAAIILRLGTPITLFVTGRRGLASQTRSRFAQRLGVPLEDIGFISGGKWHDGLSGVYVCTVETYLSKKFAKKRSMLNKMAALLFLDEAHHTGSTRWYQLTSNCRAYYRFGLTGTPTGRHDSGDLYLRAATGPVIARIKAADLIERGVLAKPTIFFTECRKPRLVYGTPCPACDGTQVEGNTDERCYTCGGTGRETWAEHYKKAIVNNEERNVMIVNYANELIALGRKPLILIKEKEHGRSLRKRIEGSKFVHGSKALSTIEKAVKRFTKGKIKCLIATTIFDEGTDIPAIDALILGTGGKSSITTLQRIGRGLRRKEGDNRLFVFDFYDKCSEHLKRHSEARIETCKAEKFPVQVLLAPRHAKRLVA